MEFDAKTSKLLLVGDCNNSTSVNGVAAGRCVYTLDPDSTKSSAKAPQMELLAEMRGYDLMMGGVSALDEAGRRLYVVARKANASTPMLAMPTDKALLCEGKTQVRCMLL